MLSGGSFVIDMSTIEVLDLSGNMKAKLTGHLNSADFFDVENHQEASFKITKVVSRGTPGSYKVEGDLTIKGITKELTLPIVQMQESEDGVTTSDDIQIIIDRTDFDIRYGSGTFFGNLGDKTIYDDFELTVNLKATR
jgi:polyisoprenoid-binding protein YceI